MTTGTDLEHDLSTACDSVFPDLALDPGRIQSAIVGGRRRRRTRLAARTGGTAGIAVLVGIGTLAVTDRTTETQQRPTALRPAASLAPDGTDLDGVTIGVLPAGYELASQSPATLETGLGLPCLSIAGANFLPAGTPGSASPVGAESLLQILVGRGPGALPGPAGGHAFGPAGDEHETFTTSHYQGPGDRSGTFTTFLVRLGPDLVATVQGTDLDTATVRQVAEGLVAGPEDQTPAPAPAAPDVSPSTHMAHC